MAHIVFGVAIMHPDSSGGNLHSFAHNKYFQSRSRFPCFYRPIRSKRDSSPNVIYDKQLLWRRVQIWAIDLPSIGVTLRRHHELALQLGQWRFENYSLQALFLITWSRPLVLRNECWHPGSGYLHGEPACFLRLFSLFNSWCTIYLSILTTSYPIPPYRWPVGLRLTFVIHVRVKY
jgi:hypothetical protein